MGSLAIMVISFCGVLYGLITLIVEMKKQKSNKDKNQMALSVAIIIVCGTTLMMDTW